MRRESEEGAEGKCDSEEGTMYRAPTGEAGTLLRRWQAEEGRTGERGTGSRKE